MFRRHKSMHPKLFIRAFLVFRFISNFERNKLHQHLYRCCCFEDYIHIYMLYPVTSLVTWPCQSVVSWLCLTDCNVRLFPPQRQHLCGWGGGTGRYFLFIKNKLMQAAVSKLIHICWAQYFSIVSAHLALYYKLFTRVDCRGGVERQAQYLEQMFCVRGLQS